MSDVDKDRFGDTLRDAEKAREDQFFAERDRQLLQKLKGTPAGGDVPAESDADTGRAVTPGTTGERGGWLARVLGRSR